MISKTDYLLYRECPKNAWIKIHKPEVFYASPVTDFEKAIMETGNEVELAARKLFPHGILIEGRTEEAKEKTRELIAAGTKEIFQAVFEKDGLFATFDVLLYKPETRSHEIYEIKASNSVKEGWHPYDLAFQVHLARKCGLKITKACIIHMNSKYIRKGELNHVELFRFSDLSGQIEEILRDLPEDIERAREFLRRADEPKGCLCIYKTRSNHCATFAHSNPDVPAYGVHDINRIHKLKLQDLADRGIFRLEDLPDDLALTDIQKNQVERYLADRPLIDTLAIREELFSIKYPLYFLDYETFPSAIPRYDGYSPYHQIPFQYSLHIIQSPGNEPVHKNFLFRSPDDPGPAFAESLRGHMGSEGTVIVWHQSFEVGRNKELAMRLPGHSVFLESVNARVYDLEKIFTKQLLVHRDFKGGTSIKDVLPVLAPDLSYKNLVIQEGGTASQKWAEMAFGGLLPSQTEQIASNLKQYCHRDTLAMVEIFKYLLSL